MGTSFIWGHHFKKLNKEEFPPFRHLIIDNDREVFLNNKRMKKLLKPRDIFLLGLGGFLDIFEELKDPLGIMAKSYESMYGFTPKRYKRHNYFH